MKDLEYYLELATQALIDIAPSQDKKIARVKLMDAKGVHISSDKVPKTEAAIKQWINKEVNKLIGNTPDWSKIGKLKITPEVEFQINNDGELIWKK